MATNNGATASDFDDNFVHLESEGDIASAFEQFWKDKDASVSKKPSSTSDEGTTPEADEAEEDEHEEASDDEANDDTEDADEPSEDDEGDEDATDDEEDSEDEGDKKKKFADDDEVYTKIKVGEEEHEVSIKDLKRLYGQEAALTKKSMEVATKTRQAEESQAKALAALDVLVKRAQESANPYREINWAALMKDPNVSAEDVAALQTAARAAFENETFLTGQLDAFMQHVQAQQAEAHKAAAAAALKSLTTEGSPNFIKGWNNDLYNDIRSFAVSQGFDKQQINQLTDPAAFKVLHMAMQFHKGSQKVVVTKKVNKSPKKIVKSSTTSTGPDSRTTRTIKRKDAVAAQRRAGGGMDATVDAFAAILGND